jgi:ABC-type multidrug transport system ATPase subunit/pSer/pThr/pTyr-binding forkhead associated (FHA) protein
MRAILEVTDGAVKGLKLEVLSAPIVVGRSPDCRLRLDPHRDTQASGHHCQIELRGDRYWVVDLNSSNGTFVNQKRVSEQPLTDGDVLTFGMGGPTARFETGEHASPQGYREPNTPAPRTGQGSGGAGPAKPPAIKLTVTIRGHSEERTFDKPIVRLGRHPSNDVQFDVTRDTLVSSSHAKLSFLEGAWVLVDLESTNGVWLKDPSGEPRQISRQTMIGGEEFELGAGGPSLRFELVPTSLDKAQSGKDPETIHFHENRIMEMAERDQVRTAQVPLGSAVVSIGRAKDNTIVIPEGQVSAHHARLSPSGDGWVLEDLGSKNGTFLDGERISRRLVRNGSEILVGGRRLEFRPPHLEVFDFERSTILKARGLTRNPGGKLILDDVSLNINMGEFVSLIGPSGGGKSTLLRALNGFRFADKGTVRIAGRDLYRDFHAVKGFLGYVPQDDAVHPQLTVSQTLHYVAKLRLPADFSSEEREEKIERVLSELELTDHRAKFVYQLSGGQRKRVCIGVELLTDPKVLFLDEPTSGLDPGMEYNMMRISRELACTGRTVVLTTHTMTNISLCDKLIFIVGGKLAFFGSPAEALRHFRVRRGEDLFIVYKDRKPEQWKKMYLSSPVCAKLLPESLDGSGDKLEDNLEQIPGANKLGIFESLRQTWNLSERFILITLADRWNMLFLLVLSPAIISVGFTAIPRYQPLMLIYSLAPLFLGVQNAAKEIVKELGVYRRERMVNLGLGPYLTSKIAVLALVAAAQVAVLVVMAHWLRPSDPWSQLETYKVCLLAAIGGVTAGLVISAAVKSQDQANTLIPIFLIANVVCSGAFQSEDPPKPAMRKVLAAVTTYWTYDELKRVAAEAVPSRESLGTVVDGLKAEFEQLGDRMKQLEAERDVAEKNLSDKLTATRAALAPKEGAPAPDPAQAYQDPQAAMLAAEAQMRQKQADLKSAMEEIDQARGQLDGVVKETKAVVERQKILGAEIKTKELDRVTAIWFNHCSVPGTNRGWIGILAAAYLTLALVFLKLQDFREY